jgi:hypothetical protein
MPRRGESASQGFDNLPRTSSRDHPRDPYSLSLLDTTEREGMGERDGEGERDQPVPPGHQGGGGFVSLACLQRLLCGELQVARNLNMV